jgi:hypothetical protein
MPRAAVSLESRLQMRAMDMLAGDFRFHEMPMEMKGAWITVVSAIIESGHGGLLAAHPLPVTHQQIEFLIEADLLSRTKDGCLGLPAQLLALYPDQEES